MASITPMTASFLGSTAITKGSAATTQKRLVVAASASARAREGEEVKVSYEADKEGSHARRNLVFAAVASAACSVAAGMAFAEEPKRGSPEAKKIYAPICVTMPTARICRN